MKQVVVKKGEVKVEDVPRPFIGKGNVLVEVAYSVISTGTEIEGMKQSGKSLLRRAIEHPEQVKKLIQILSERGMKKTIAFVESKVGAPQPLGYSCAGVVLQVGEGVEEIKPGDYVACAGAGKASHAEIVLVPKNLVVKVPEGLSLKEAASVALGAIAMQGMRRADSKLGDIVAVIGLGLLGQLTVQLLKITGCRVIGFDLRRSRVNLAKEMGIDWGFVSSEVDPQKEALHLTEGHGVDITIITAAAPGDDSIVQLATEITRKKGKIVVVGDVGLGFRRSPLYEKEIDVLISTSYGPGRYDELYEEKGLDYPYAYVRWTEKRNMEEYLRLLAEGKLNFSRLVGGIYPVEQAPEAYQTLQEGDERPLAVILDYRIGETDLARKLSTRIETAPGSKVKAGPLKVGVIGAGSFAKAVHLPNLKKLSHLCTIRAVCSATGLHAKETAKEFGATYCASDYREILADAEIDMVIISTRHNLHARMALEAIKAGKAVFLEKPMALNTDELEALVNVLKETKLPFTVGFNRRFSPAAIKAKEIIGNRKNSLMVIYRVNAGYIPLDNWVHGEEGGGRIIGEACHMFDLFNYFVGADVESVDVSAISPATEHISFKDNFVATLKYTDGSVCTLIYTALGAAELPKEYIEIYCDGKTLIIDDFKELRVYGSKAKGWKGSQDKGHLRELEEFAQTVLKGGPWPISLDELVKATEISFLVDEEVKQ